MEKRRGIAELFSDHRLLMVVSGTNHQCYRTEVSGGETTYTTYGGVLG